LTCDETLPIFKRIFSDCKYPDNKYCDDGENWPADKDCKVSKDNVQNGNIFTKMWIFRLLLILMVVLTLRKSDLMPFAVILFVSLLVYNGALASTAVANATAQQEGCTGTSFLSNPGACLTPTNPLIGWIIVAGVIIGFYIW
jgi:pheromone shutdown protein TraB